MVGERTKLQALVESKPFCYEFSCNDGHGSLFLNYYQIIDVRGHNYGMVRIDTLHDITNRTGYTWKKKRMPCPVCLGNKLTLDSLFEMNFIFRKEYFGEITSDE